MAPTREEIDAALQGSQTVDITTIGRQTGQPRTLEIVFHNLGGRIYISAFRSPIVAAGWRTSTRILT